MTRRSGPGLGDGNPPAQKRQHQKNQRPDQANRDAIRRSSSLWVTARDAVKLGGQSLQWEIMKQGDDQELAEMANSRRVFCDNVKTKRLLESYQALIRRGANALPLCCQEYYYHQDNIWMLVPCAIVRVRRKAKGMWEVGYFRGDRPESVCTGVVSDEIIQWLLTARAYRMVMKWVEKDPKGWKKVTKPQYHQSFVDTLYYIKARPRADGGVVLLSTNNGCCAVSYDDEDLSSGNNMWQALKKEIDTRRAEKNPDYYTFPFAISARSVQKGRADSYYVYAEPRVEIKFKETQDDDTFLIASALASYASYINYPKAGRLLRELAEVKMNGSYGARCGSIVKNHLNHWYRLNLNSFDPLTHAAKVPVVAKLQSAKWNRCVVFYQGMIFEPTLEFALKLSERNLHNLCGGAYCYNGIAWACGFAGGDPTPSAGALDTNPRAGLTNEPNAASQVSTLMVAANKLGQAKGTNGNVGGATLTQASVSKATGGENNDGISKEEGSKENLVVHNGKHARVLSHAGTAGKEPGCDEGGIENPPASLIGSSLLATINN